MSNIYFSGDAHIGHQGILKFMPERPHTTDIDTTAHDEWLIDLWQKTVGNHDRIYFAGDLTFYKSENARRLLERLPGEKFLAVGNHDDSIKAHSNYFRKVAQIMEVIIKPAMCDCLQEKLHIVLCHYPLLDWPGKHQGSIMIHGHCHGTMDKFNNMSSDIRFDIGIDSELSRSCAAPGEYSGLVSLEALYEAIMKKTGGHTPSEYAKRTIQYSVKY